MKKLLIFAFAAVCAAALALSCQKEPSIEITPKDSKIVTLTCAFPKLTDARGTKVSLATDGKTEWEVGDKIVIFGQPSSEDESKRVVHEIIASDITNPEIASFSVDLSGLTPENSTDNNEFAHAYNVLFPYSEGLQYYYGTGKSNYGRARFQNTNQLLLAGYVSDDLTSIVLNPITAAITFSVSGDFDSYIFSGRNGTEVVGYSNLAVEMNSTSAPKYRQKYNNGGTTGAQTSITGSVNGNGTAVNYIFLPVNAQRSGSSPDYSYDVNSERGANVVYLPDGFTIQFRKSGVVTKYITSSAPLILRPGEMINLSTLPSGSMHDYVAPTTHGNKIGVTVGTATDLSADASANCYMIDGSTVAANAQFKFKAQKGKGGALITDFNTAEDNDVVVLWETKNTTTAPTSGDIIAAVDYDMQEGEDAYIVFKMPATITPGNALIAAKNSAGEIVWSWHIWIPETTVTDVDAGFAATSKLMDRNLGALVAVPGGTTTTPTTAYGLYYQWGRKDPFYDSTIKGAPGSAISVGTTAITTEEAIQNPSKYIYLEGVNWNSSNISTLWNDSGKTSFDPCPPGYRVPVYDAVKDLWIKTDTNWTHDATYKYFYFSTTSSYFPLPGYINGGSCNLSGSGAREMIWSATASSSDSASGALIRDNAYNNVKLHKAAGASVRCVAE